MVKLRLRRKGRIHHAVYDVVAVDGRARRDGAYLERLGYFDPNTSPSTIKINPDRAIHWLNNGAQPTEVVKLLLSYEGILLRRHLTFKGKTAEEIQTAVDQHKAATVARYQKRKTMRAKRAEAKAAAKAE